MTVETEAGYTWTDGNAARILHEGVRFPIKTITATADSGSTADLVDNDITVDRWTPFANGLTDPTDLSEADWTATNVTVATDGQQLTETTDTGEHDVSQAYTFTAVEHVVAWKVERVTVPEVQVRANDGTTSFTCFFDLRDKSVGTAANCTGQIVDLGGGEFLLSIRFTPVAATGVVELLLSNGSETVSYTGSTSNIINVLSGYVNASSASLRLDTWVAQGGTCFGIAAHNLWSTGGRIAFEHDSDENDTWTTIGTVTPTDDGPLMFFFASVSSPRWRITVDRAAVPKIGVVRIGDPLVMQRTIYAGASPARMNRATDVISNISHSGELLGRSRKRTILMEGAEWQNLTYSWVRSNLDGVNGLIQSIETNAFFMAWRPENAAPDVSYFMRAEAGAPKSMGVSDLWSFGLSGEVHAYE